MRLHENLYRTPEGQWRIKFVGEQLKTAMKRHKVNIFDLPFPPTLVETLEAYLTTWRPILAGINNAPEVFLMRDGQPFTARELRRNAQYQVAHFLGRHWHPHMIRTTWATEWLHSSGDFMTAAIMLNDRLETVIQNYSHLREENVAEKAFEWVQNRVNGH
jgi:site-specific recombinase XerC